MQNFLIFGVAVQSALKLKLFKRDFLDVISVLALSNVKKLHLASKNFPVIPVSLS